VQETGSPILGVTAKLQLVIETLIPDEILFKLSYIILFPPPFEKSFSAGAGGFVQDYSCAFASTENSLSYSFLHLESSIIIIHFLLYIYIYIIIIFNNYSMGYYESLKRGDPFCCSIIIVTLY
jgi:hypothetical protein